MVSLPEGWAGILKRRWHLALPLIADYESVRCFESHGRTFARYYCEINYA